MGLKALSKVQMGRESTKGTAVAADFIWRGPFAGLKDARETVMVDEDIAVGLPTSRKYAAKEMAEFELPSTPLTPEQAPHVFEAGIKAVATGVTDGTGGSGYVYAYPFGVSAINSISSYTVETGDDIQAEEAAYCVVKDFTISAVKGETVMISSNWFGRTVSNTTFTGALTPQIVSHIHASNGTLYIDDNDGAFGGTQLTGCTLLEATLNVKTGRVGQFTADSGQLYFCGEYFNIDEFEAELELKFIHTSDVVSEKGKWRTNEPRLIRLEFTGDDYATPGTGTGLGGKKGIQIDMPGSYMEFSALEHDEGRSIVTATLNGGYEAVSGEGLAIRIFNEISALV